MAYLRLEKAYLTPHPNPPGHSVKTGRSGGRRRLHAGGLKEIVKSHRTNYGHGSFRAVFRGTFFKRQEVDSRLRRATKGERRAPFIVADREVARADDIHTDQDIRAATQFLSSYNSQIAEFHIVRQPDIDQIRFRRPDVVTPRTRLIPMALRSQSSTTRLVITVRVAPVSQIDLYSSKAGAAEPSAGV